eukprot:TRINITY_DN11833_c0_g1_i1.p1 TRINITY_DN11833_c0_g1~~TRINITY_DN11833_c0_g1_i1.p1  ORF type:complete len:833 (-),score=58.64 TRINITY_DN11833_c0_g1_i1:60-2558(-)
MGSPGVISSCVRQACLSSHSGMIGIIFVCLVSSCWTESSIDFRSEYHSTTGCPLVHAGPEISSRLSEAAGRLLRPLNGSCNVVVALGRVEEARSLVSFAAVQALRSSDAFVVRSSLQASGIFVAACVGVSPRATAFAFYELLQNLGFAFLHPLKPIIPLRLPASLPDLNLTGEPRWEFRGTHYHTQHPLELTSLLNGYDSNGGHTDFTKWSASLPQWSMFLDWMLAQKQNYVEWMLLADTKKSESNSDRFELSESRKGRLAALISIAHDFGIEVGADVPLTLVQQHALCLLPNLHRASPISDAEIRSKVRWFIDCGFDHLGTELGSTEFTNGLVPKEQVRALNIVKAELGPSRRLLVKQHCATHEIAKGFSDPRPEFSGADINFNYLSYYADASIVSMPHTVQIYSLRDPAPTYGNSDFSDLRDWSRYLLQEGRPVVFYPETSYWVNYDSNVPLFLAPVYTKSRVEDALDLDSMTGPRPLLGQLNFESGWQWGYWLANSAQAAVAWNHMTSTESVFEYIFRFLGPAERLPLVTLLNDFADSQHELLIEGIKSAPRLPGIGAGAHTGISYIMGSEGLSDLGVVLDREAGKGAPQPDRLRFPDMWTSEIHFPGSERAFTRRQWYRKHLRPLLSRMNDTFDKLSRRFERLLPVAHVAEESLRDLFVSSKLLSGRCAQVLALYEYAAECVEHIQSENSASTTWCNSMLAAARKALASSQALVPEREANYGIDGDALVRQIRGWRTPNPTAYNFGYLWAVHNLFYWERDQAIVEGRIHSPCFGNINDPVELGFASGGSSILRDLQRVLAHLLPHEFSACLAAPDVEPRPLAQLSLLV